MEPIVYELKDPIVFGSETITKLEFKPLKAKHLREVSSKIGMNDFLKLASKLSGVENVKIDEMSARDSMAVIDIVANFIVDGKTTGEAE